MVILATKLSLIVPTYQSIARHDALQDLKKFGVKTKLICETNEWSWALREVYRHKGFALASELRARAEIKKKRLHFLWPFADLTEKYYLIFQERAQVHPGLVQLTKKGFLKSSLEASR